MGKTAALARVGLLAAGFLLVSGLSSVGVARAAAAPWLGVYTQELTDELRDGMDYKGTNGVLVNRVVPDSPAERAGLKKGDVILGVNSKDVESPADLQDVIRAKKAGESVTLAVFRDGRRTTVTARLAERESGDETPQGDDQENMGPGDRHEVEIPDLGDLKDLPGGDEGDRRTIVRRFETRGDDGGRQIQVMVEGRGRLGVRVEPLNEDLGGYFGVPDGKGVLVLEVLKDTPAERAGLKSGDVIVRVADRDVADRDDLVNALGDREGAVMLRIMRKGGSQTVQVTLDKPERVRTRQFGMLPGQERRIVRLRPGQPGDVNGDVRKELDDLRQQIDELQRRLDEGGNRR